MVFSLARRVGTNANHLSYYLNAEKGVSFPRYLSEVRIAYMATQLAEDPEMLKKNTQELTVSCGIMSSSNFLHLFQRSMESHCRNTGKSAGKISTGKRGRTTTFPKTACLARHSFLTHAGGF